MNAPFASSCSRRDFLRTIALGSLAFAMPNLPAQTSSANTFRILIGACQSHTKWELMQKAGCSYVEDSVGKLLIPLGSDEEFQKTAKEVKGRQVPILACNGFLPGELKLVGPNVSHDKAVAYASTALQRASHLGIGLVILGSGGARNVPEGFDRAEADNQFITVVRRIGEAAAKENVMVAMESLNRSETNFGNTLRECLGLIDKINHPHVRLTADLYHMLREDESPEALIKAGAKVVHCHVAEEARRTAPGVSGQDFKPYLRALKQIGFKGGISIECRWKDFDTEVKPAVTALKAQVASVFS